MELTPQQINEFIAKTVMDSQIGEVVKGAVQRSIAELSKSYNNPFDDVVKRYVRELIEKEVLATYAPLLETGIKDAMAKHMTDEVMQSIIKAALAKLESRY
jgi:uncharacterized membrane-anchored protein YjiN (DUF445 family)